MKQVIIAKFPELKDSHFSMRITSLPMEEFTFVSFRYCADNREFIVVENKVIELTDLEADPD